MKPVAFRIQNYKGVLDSGWIELASLTVIVGKNESGKTTLLKALHKFKPYSAEPYVINREWPRGHRREQNSECKVCTVKFSLSPAELSAIKAITDLEVSGEPIQVAKTYSGKMSVELNATAFPSRPLNSEIASALAAIPAVPAEASDAFKAKTHECHDSAKKAIATSFVSTAVAKLVETQTAILKKAVVEESKTPEEAYIQVYTAKLREVGTQLAGLVTIRKKAEEFVLSKLPTFIYMDDYKSFQGSILLDQLQQRKNQGQLTEQDKTVLMLLELSGLKLAEVISKAAADLTDERQYDLSDAGRTLTNDISARWTQRSYEIDFRADAQKFMTFVKDETDPSLIPLEDRSKGFQWFFSFDLMLMHETKGTFKDAVLLLDEPGLHLHPDAQKNLLNRLEKYAEGNSLIYSTHMPFMIDLRHPERIRVISESPGKGTVVHSDLAQSQKEAKFVLQAALGMSGSQSYLVSQRNLVVEGVDDYWIICELSNLLRRSGELGLPEDVFITPAGGASEAAYIATFMIGQKLDVAVLLDSDDSGKEAHDKLVKTWLSCYQDRKADVLLLGEVVGAGSSPFATEDLFAEEYFLNVVRAAYKKELTLAGSPALTPLPEGGLLWRRVSRALVSLGIQYDSDHKGRVAKGLRSALLATKSFGDLPKETQEMARRLIGKIREIFPSEDSTPANEEAEIKKSRKRKEGTV